MCSFFAHVCKHYSNFTKRFRVDKSENKIYDHKIKTSKAVVYVRLKIKEGGNQIHTFHKYIRRESITRRIFFAVLCFSFFVLNMSKNKSEKM